MTELRLASLQQNIGNNTCSVSSTKNEIENFESKTKAATTRDNESSKSNDALKDQINDVKSLHTDGQTVDEPLTQKEKDVNYQHMESTKMPSEKLVASNEDRQQTDGTSIDVNTLTSAQQTKAIKKHPSSNIPEIDENTLKQAKVRSLAPGGDEIFISYWDCAGEEEYYGTHHIHFTSDAVYLLVFNMTKIEADGKLSDFRWEWHVTLCDHTVCCIARDR